MTIKTWEVEFDSNLTRFCVVARDFLQAANKARAALIKESKKKGSWITRSHAEKAPITTIELIVETDA